MKSNIIPSLLLLVLLSFANVRCANEVIEVVADPENIQNALQIGASLLQMLDKFSDENKSFKTDALALTTSTNESVTAKAEAGNIYENWQTQWKNIKSEYNDLSITLAQIKDTSDLYFSVLWETNHGIQNIKYRLEDSAKNSTLQAKWLKKYDQAASSLHKAASMITHGDDVEKILRNFVARQEIAAYVDELQDVSDEATELSKNIESFTINVSSIFKAQQQPANPDVTLSKTDTPEHPTEIAPAPVPGVQPASCTINDVRIEFDVYNQNEKGLKVHVNFNVANKINMNGRCSAYLFYEDGSKLHSLSPRYTTTDGQVSSFDNFSPNDANTNYNDFVLFVPYSTFDLPQGSSYKLKTSVCVLDLSSADSSNTPILKESDFIHFNYNN